MEIENQKFKKYSNKFSMILVPSIFVGIWIPILIIDLVGLNGFEGFLKLKENTFSLAYFIFILKVFLFFVLELCATFSGMLVASFIFCQYHKKKGILSEDEMRNIINFPNRNSRKIGRALIRIHDKINF